MNKTILKNTLSLFGTRFAGYIIPLISLPYLTRVLGPQSYGELGFSTALCQYFIIIVSYGFDLSATQKVSIERNNKKIISQIYFNILSVRLLLSIVGFFILMLLAKFSVVIEEVFPIVVAVYLSVISAALFPQWLFQGKEELAMISFIRIIFQFLNLLLIFNFVQEPDDVFYAAIISTMPGIAIVFVSFFIIHKKKWVHFVFPSKKLMKDELKNGWDIFVANIVGSAYQNSIPVLLGFFSGPNGVAVYTAAYKLFKASQGLYLSVSGAFYPHVNKVYKENKIEAKVLILKIIKIQSILGLVVGVFMFLLSDIVVDVLFGLDYKESANVLKVLSPLLLIIGIGNCLGIQTLLTFGFRKELSKIYVKCGIMSLLISIPSCYFVGAYGAAVSVLVVEMLVTFLLYIEVKNKKIL